MNSQLKFTDLQNLLLSISVLPINPLITSSSFQNPFYFPNPFTPFYLYSIKRRCSITFHQTGNHQTDMESYQYRTWNKVTQEETGKCDLSGNSMLPITRTFTNSGKCGKRNNEMKRDIEHF